MDYYNQIAKIINSHDHKLSRLKPSDWTEKNRVMGKSTTARPGKFEYAFTPYLREPVDCLGLDSDARVVAVMKGAQIGFSTGVIESGIGWIISQQPGNIMLLARDESLVKRMMERKIDPMIDGCGIRHLIKPNVIRKRNQRTGDTSMGKEFAGGGLFAGSVQTPEKMRQDAVQYAFIDDFEAAPKSSKTAGDTTSLIETRMSSFYHKMKLFYISTPEVQQTSNIEPVYLLGDQRRYTVPCPCCGSFIILEWEIELSEKERAGITWKLDKSGKIVKGSVGYVCQDCGGFFSDKHKYDMNLAGIWKPTAEPSEPGYYSYHISSLYAPPGMYTWEHYARLWVQAHPPGGETLVAKEKTFYNTCLGLTYEEKTVAPEAKLLQQNQRKYKIGIIPVQQSLDDGNGEIALITCAADMNGNFDDARLDYEIVAWSVSGASYSISHGSIGTFIPNESQKKIKVDRKKCTYREGASNSIWPVFKKIIEKDYVRDSDGETMNILVTGLDTGYFAKYAYNFLEMCNPPFVLGLKGKDVNEFKKLGANQSTFQISKERSDLYILDVNLIKDDLSDSMKLKWNSRDEETQPHSYMNFPESSNGLYGWNNFFSHFESEHKVMEKNSEGEYTRSKWVKKNNSVQNHLWDCRVYNMALRDIFVHLFCKENKVINPDWRKYCDLLGLEK